MLSMILGESVYLKAETAKVKGVGCGRFSGRVQNVGSRIPATPCLPLGEMQHSAWRAQLD